jgi:hypothetical protein
MGIESLKNGFSWEMNQFAINDSLNSFQFDSNMKDIKEKLVFVLKNGISLNCFVGLQFLRIFSQTFISILLNTPKMEIACGTQKQHFVLQAIENNSP